MPTEDQLTDAIADAARNAVSDLFREHPEHFYYCSLITTGKAHAPALVAWSKEALEAAVATEENPEEAKWEIEWSYADSPYYCYGEAHFDSVKRLFDQRPEMSPDMTEEEWMNEFHLRLRAMERAMARLDSEGIFGTGDARLDIVINAEVMPPDYTNTERGIRLNPKDALGVWLSEVAEPIEDGDGEPTHAPD